MNISLLPMDRLKFIFLNGVLEWGGWVILSIILIPRMGILAVTLSHFIINLVTLILTYLYHKMTTGYVILKQNWILIAKVLPLTIIGMGVSQLSNHFLLNIVFPALIAIILLVWAPTKEELLQLFSLIKTQSGKLRGKTNLK